MELHSAWREEGLRMFSQATVMCSNTPIYMYICEMAKICKVYNGYICPAWESLANCNAVWFCHMLKL